jgi:hypothetical protein
MRECARAGDRLISKNAAREAAALLFMRGE